MNDCSLNPFRTDTTFCVPWDTQKPVTNGTSTTTTSAQDAAPSTATGSALESLPLPSAQAQAAAMAGINMSRGVVDFQERIANVIKTAGEQIRDATADLRNPNTSKGDRAQAKEDIELGLDAQRLAKEAQLLADQGNSTKAKQKLKTAEERVRIDPPRDSPEGNRFFGPGSSPHPADDPHLEMDPDDDNIFERSGVDPHAAAVAGGVTFGVPLLVYGAWKAAEFAVIGPAAFVVP